MKQLVALHPHDLWFPPIESALDDPPGLLAVGGDLSPERLLSAYRQGIFPWFDEHSPLLWWSPDPRMILQPRAVHISRSLRRTWRRGDFSISMDVAFDEVISHCAVLREDHGTWITPEMQAAYTQLHEQGYAHSVEVWHNDALVGGLYGISLGRMFFGESMFSLETDASKLAFVALSKQLERWQFNSIDCQLPTDHLHSLGARPVSRQHFSELLQDNLRFADHCGHWQFDPQCMGELS